MTVFIFTSIGAAIGNENNTGPDQEVKESLAFGLAILNTVTASQGFGIEFMATFQLVLCVLATTDKRRRDVTGSAILAGGLSVGPGRLAAVYRLGPLIGEGAAVLDYNFFPSPKYGDYSNRRDTGTLPP
ncbi:aquaporin-1-like [Brienomyrus brachyistius]|uniref:aquaporin-1-like n=1 Tax=Brienomyrus brachyistius TaxID=42636 RepID=UPI0020B3F52A|nr:aquaporin-1-like [Brienomyrus brachyistius]